ncbi:tetratricopeptide repeat protein, partial [Streptomyces sp. SID5770]
MAERETPGAGTPPDELGRTVAALRRAARADPGRYLPRLGYTLLRFGSLLATEPGRMAESVDVLGEAAEVYRRLSGEHLPGLGIALQRQALGLGALGRHQEGLGAAREAVEVWRGLAAEGVEGSRAELAGALLVLGGRLAETGRHHEALDRIHEAVETRRLLVDRADGTGRTELASALQELGVKLGEMGRQEEALVPLRASVAAYRETAGTAGGRAVGDLGGHAVAAFATGRALLGLGRTDEARPYFAEAAALHTEITAREPAATAFLDHLFALHGHRLTYEGGIAAWTRTPDGTTSSDRPEDGPATSGGPEAPDRPDATPPARTGTTTWTGASARTEAAARAGAATWTGASAGDETAARTETSASTVPTASAEDGPATSGPAEPAAPGRGGPTRPGPAASAASGQ